ncbi:MAG: hydroxymethylbilane synthase [Thermanaeromonas sp.]|uniref:hydroxymethylbilane synthase n=1 Tax=Thermanaeromonas sp. TaxID=2003697 RepID=UPI0024396045|nr:hydroxymethylbilane synthase [Thermanaeromonas sp.]MCG0277854.1 hydroxymethylbilane synthase [Thermanaeromonas sp.]
MGLKLVVGSRESALARWQAEWVIAALKRVHPELKCELVTLKTKGDKILDVALARIGDKGLFTKELEIALEEGRIDVAVHSMKDVPTVLPHGLVIGAIGPREDPRDVLVSRRGQGWTGLPAKARLGTSSLRRKAQLWHWRPDLEIVDLRGNVTTRLAKMEKEGLDGIILAAAGLKRLRMSHWVSEELPYDICLPAVGQGAIGVEVRKDDKRVLELIKPLNDPPSFACVQAERAFLRELEGGCQVPIAALGRAEGSCLILEGMVASLDGRELLRDVEAGSVSRPEEVGKRLAAKLLKRGARAILEGVRRSYGAGQR